MRRLSHDDFGYHDHLQVNGRPDERDVPAAPAPQGLQPRSFLDRLRALLRLPGRARVAR